jgi:hypothetical protein
MAWQKTTSVSLAKYQCKQSWQGQGPGVGMKDHDRWLLARKPLES